MKNENRYAQRHSKVSESDGCPSGYAGRMGETVSAQRHSKVSERLSKMAHKTHRTHRAIVQSRCPECCLKTITACAQRLSNSSECQGS